MKPSILYRSAPVFFAALVAFPACAPVADTSDQETESTADLTASKTNSSKKKCEDMSSFKDFLEAPNKAEIAGFTPCKALGLTGALGGVASTASTLTTGMFRVVPAAIAPALATPLSGLGIASVVICTLPEVAGGFVEMEQSQCFAENAQERRLTSSLVACSRLRKKYPERKSWFTDWCPSVSSGATYCIPRSVIDSKHPNYPKASALRCLQHDGSQKVFHESDEVFGWPAKLAGQQGVKSKDDDCTVKADGLACSD